MDAKSILFSEMRPDPSWEGEFNSWYHTEHIPVRLRIAGFEGAQRYKASEDENYLVVYDMTSLDVLKTPQYQVVKNEPSERTAWMLANVTNFTRYLGTEIGREGRIDDETIEAPLIFVAMFNVPDQDKADFDGWMTQDHMPILLRNPDWLGVRRFELTVAEPTPFNRLSIHYLASSQALSSPERAEARGTEWRARLAQKPWFGQGFYKGFTRLDHRYTPQNV